MDIPIEKKKFPKSKLLMIGGAAAIVILILYVVLSSTGNTKLNVQKERLSISTVNNGIFQENIPVNGVVMPITTIYLDALEGGRVEEKFVEDGAIMKQGEPILRLTNTDLELSLVNQETSVYNLLTQMQISQNAARQNTINKLNQYTDVESSLIEAERLYNLNKKLFEKTSMSLIVKPTSRRSYCDTSPTRLDGVHDRDLFMCFYSCILVLGCSSCLQQTEDSKLTHICVVVGTALPYSSTQSANR